MPFALPDLPLHEVYPTETARIRQQFERTGDGRAAVLERSALVDTLLARLYRDWMSTDLAGPENLCLVALGGYGRRALFPHSDIDLLFLSENNRVEESHREAVAGVSRALWDLQLRLSPTARTLEEIGRASCRERVYVLV